MKRSRGPEEQDGDPSASASPSPGPSGAAASPAPFPEAQQRAHKIVAGNSSDSDSEQETSPSPTQTTTTAATTQNDPATMKCSMPPHREALAFKSYADYEVHYRKAHTNRCVECGRNLPSEHLLGVHIEECHDVFAALRRERGEHTVSSPSIPLPP